MADELTGQVTRNAAEVYEEFFVPALFLEWAARVVNEARLAPGQKVLDVACGTGVLAREAARRVQPGGEVAGLDRNEGMLSLARRKPPASIGGSGWRNRFPLKMGCSTRWSANSGSCSSRIVSLR